jgi:hypothetical protein
MECKCINLYIQTSFFVVFETMLTRYWVYESIIEGSSFRHKLIIFPFKIVTFQVPIRHSYNMSSR